MNMQELDAISSHLRSRLAESDRASSAREPEDEPEQQTEAEPSEPAASASAAEAAAAGTGSDVQAAEAEAEGGEVAAAGTTTTAVLLTALLHTHANTSPPRDARQLLEELEAKGLAKEATSVGYQRSSPLVFTAGTTPGAQQQQQQEEEQQEQQQEEKQQEQQQEEKQEAEAEASGAPPVGDARGSSRSLEATADAETMRVLRIMARKGLRSSAK